MLETKCNNLDLPERRHIGSGDFPSDRIAGSLVEDPGITNKKGLYSFLNSNEYLDKKKQKRILAENGYRVTKHTERRTHLFYLFTALLLRRI